MHALMVVNLELATFGLDILSHFLKIHIIRADVSVLNLAYILYL